MSEADKEIVREIVRQELLEMIRNNADNVTGEIIKQVNLSLFT